MNMTTVLLIISLFIIAGLCVYVEYLITLKNLYKDSLNAVINAKKHHVDYNEILSKINNDEWVMK